ADQFEALASSITVGDCIDYDSLKAESYMKAGYAIRQEQRALRGEVESLVKKILNWTGLRKIQINPVQALKLA
ncbi:hypothetical protein L7W77_000001, partial [Klebsiella pneumoniae]|nr:hypothetical protein [Klebsiella pneumoniae]